MNQDPNMPVVEQPTTPVVPTEPVAPTEEPVMIAANIDDLPLEEQPIIPPKTTAPVEPTVEVPAVAPDLGQPNQPDTQPPVATFQELGNIPVEGQPDTPVVEETPAVPETVPPVAPVVPTDAPAAEEQVPTFQQLGDVPVEGQPSPTAMEEAVTLDEEEDQEEKPDKKKKFIPILAVVLILGMIIGGVSLALNGLSSLGEEDLIKTLKPVRSDSSRTNIAIIGTENSKRDEVLSMLDAVYGGTESQNECTETNGRYLSYVTKKGVIKTKKAYEAFVPCDFESQIKYLVDGDGNNTVDGAIVVVSAEEGLPQEIKTQVQNLKTLDIKKIIVIVVGDKSKVEEEIITLLDTTGFDSTYTPILAYTELNEEAGKEVMDKIDTNIKKVTSKKQAAAVQSFDKLKLFTYFKSKDGLSSTITPDTLKTLKLSIEGKDYDLNLTFPENYEALEPGEHIILDAKLKEKVPLETGMRLPISQDGKVVAIGVITELK